MTSRTGRNSSPFTPGLVVGRRAWLTAGLGALVLGPSALVHADDRTDYLINLLRTSSTTRVRAQAALSLGRLSRSAEALAALVQALGNTSEDPTVRVAAAAALGRMGDRAAMAPLQQAARDRNATVRQAATEALAALRSSGSGSGGSGHETRPEPSGGGGPDRFYVGIGQPGTSVSGVDDAVLGRMRTFLTEQADRTSGVRVAPTGESASQVRRILSRERLSGFYLEDVEQLNELAERLGLKMTGEKVKNRWVGLKYVN